MTETCLKFKLLRGEGATRLHHVGEVLDTGMHALIKTKFLISKLNFISKSRVVEIYIDLFLPDVCDDVQDFKV